MICTLDSFLVNMGCMDMSRPKKDGIYLNIKLDRELYERLERISEEAGQTKTLIAERALTTYMDSYEENQAVLQRIKDGSAKLVDTNEQS